MAGFISKLHAALGFEAGLVRVLDEPHLSHRMSDGRLGFIAFVAGLFLTASMRSPGLAGWSCHSGKEKKSRSYLQ
jgi:hypothetical protein